MFLKILKHNSESGAAMLEVALLASLIAMGCIGAIGSMGEEVENVFIDTSQALAGAGNHSDPPLLLGN